MNVTENHQHTHFEKPKALEGKKQFTRAERRGIVRKRLRDSGKRWSASPSATISSGRPTGSTTHFKMWMADARLKSALQNTKVTRLAAQAEEARLVAAYQILADAGFKNVFALTRATREQLLALKGFGPKRLDAVKFDLAAHQVQVNW